MYQMCPRCLKNGTKSKIKAYQINLREAVWLCETTDCIWPFSSEEVEYISREVGKKWSYNWTTYKAQPNKPKEPLVQDLFLYTPPDTPGTDASKDISTGDEHVTNDPSNSAVYSDHNYAHSNEMDLPDVSYKNVCKYTGLDNLIQADPIQEDVKCGDINLSTKGVPTVTNIVKFEKSAWQEIDKVVVSNERCEETKNEDSKHLENVLKSSKLTTQKGVNKMVLIKESSEKRCTNMANSRINFKKSLKNGDSKKYEKFSFDKVVNKKTDNETTLPKKVDEIVPKNVEGHKINCTGQQECNNKTTNDSPELDFESLLNEMSAKEDYCNDQTFDNDWLDSLFETV